MGQVKILLSFLFLTIIMLAEVQAISIGDVMLNTTMDSQGYQEVLIFYTDGNNAPAWGGICGTTSDNYDGMVICRQLGYTGGSAKSNVISTASPIVWFERLECGDNPNHWHTLRCDYTVISSANKQNPCGQRDERLLIKCSGSLITENPYEGQVYLCPPDQPELDSTRTSVSFGLIGIYIKSEWRGLNQPIDSKSLRRNVGDALCRQLGYTEAVPSTAITATAAINVSSNYTFNNCYSRDPKNTVPIQTKAWFTTDDIGNCKDNSNAYCSGCCFNYPSSSSDACLSCVKNNDLVVQCTFDDSKLDTVAEAGWPTQQCAFTKGAIKYKCEGVCSVTEDTAEAAALGVMFALALFANIVFIIVVIVLSCYIRKTCCFRQYNQID